MRRISAMRFVLVVLGLSLGSLLGVGTASAADSSVDIGDALVIERPAAPVVRHLPAPCGHRVSALVKLRCTPKGHAA
jgi:hypothetical protein